MTLNFVLKTAGSSSIAPWIMGAAALLAAFVAAWVALRTHRTTRLVENITAERAKWRSELRREMGRLSATIHEGIETGEMNQKAFHQARVGILLRINPEGRKAPQPCHGGHRLDLTIDQKLRTLMTQIDGGAGLSFRGGRESVRCNLAILEHAVQDLLKQEWEGSKEEALSGKLKRSATVAPHPAAGNRNRR